MRIPSGKTDQVIYFVAVDATDLKTRETALSAFTVYRSRNGGAATVYTTPTVTELSAANMPGVYSLLVDEDTTIAAGSDSEEYVVHITEAAMAPVTRSIELYRRDTTTGQTITVANGAADADIERIQGTVVSTPATAGILDVNVKNIDNDAASASGTVTFPNATLASTTNITAGTITTATNVTTVNGLAANVITAAATAADFGAEIADAVWDEDATGHQTQGTFGQAIGDPAADANTIYAAVVTNAAGATIAADIIGIQSDTDDIQTRLPAALVGGRIDANVGAISSDATAADNAEAFFDGTGYAGTNNVIPLVTTATNVTTVNGLAANVITAASMNVDASAEIADAVWDEDATAHQTQGTFGQAIGDPGADTDTIWALANTNLDAAVGSRMATYAQPTGFLAATFPAGTVANTTNITAGTITTATNVTTVNGLAANVITAASIATDAIDADALAADAVTEIAAGISVPSAATVADAVWDEAIAGHVGAGSTGAALTDVLTDTGTTLDAKIDTIDTVVDAIKAKTDSLTFTVANQIDANIQYVNDVQVNGNGSPGTEWGP